MLLTFIKLPFVIKIFVLSVFEWLVTQVLLYIFMAVCKDRTGLCDVTRVQNFRTFTLFFCYFHFIFVFTHDLTTIFIATSLQCVSIIDAALFFSRFSRRAKSVRENY